MISALLRIETSMHILKLGAELLQYQNEMKERKKSQKKNSNNHQDCHHIVLIDLQELTTR